MNGNGSGKSPAVPTSPLQGNPLYSVVLQKGGKAGAVGIFLAAVGQLAISSGLLNAKWFPFFSALTGLGTAIAVLAIAFSGKRVTDMVATTQAENKTQSNELESKSADPAVQRAIDQIKGTPTS